MTVKPQMDLDLSDLIEIAKRNTFYSLNKILPARVVSYDDSDNTVNCEIMLKRNINGDEVDYPVMAQCPVMILGAEAHITFPIEAGQNCLLMFSDRDIDIFWSSGEKKTPNTRRAHAFADAIALIGLRTESQAQPINPNAVQIEGAGKKVAIKNDAQSLKLLIDQLIDTIKAITVAGGTPVDGSAQLALEALKPLFAALLDEGV